MAQREVMDMSTSFDFSSSLHLRKTMCSVKRMVAYHIRPHFHFQSKDEDLMDVRVEWNSTIRKPQPNFSTKQYSMSFICNEFSFSLV